MASRRLPWQSLADSSALDVFILSNDSEEAMLFMQIFIYHVSLKAMVPRLQRNRELWCKDSDF